MGTQFPLVKGGQRFHRNREGLSESPDCDADQDNPQGLLPLPTEAVKK
jgi:hypothetical protein